MRVPQNRTSNGRALIAAVLTGRSATAFSSVFRDRSFGRVLRDPTLYQLPHQGSRQRAVRRETDGASAGVVTFEFIVVGLQRVCTRIEGAMFLGRAKRHQQFSAQTKAWNSVADAFFRLGRRGLDPFAQILKRSPLLFAQRRQVFV